MDKRSVRQEKTDFIPERKTTEQYEDFFQEMLAMMLPSVNRRNIRPSYSNTIAFASIVDEKPDYTTETNGIDADDTLIYFKVIYDNEAIESFVHQDGTIQQQRFLNLKVEIYGKKRQQIGIILNALIRADYILHYLNYNGMWLYNTGNGNGDAHEFMHGQWYERYDIEWTFNECLEIDVPKLPTTAKEANVTVVEDEPIKTITVRVK